MQDNRKLNDNLKVIKEYLQGKINSSELNDKVAQNYVALIENCDKLTEKTDEFYTPNQDGSLKLMSLEEKDNLLKIYQDIVSKTEAILKEEPVSDIEKDLHQNCNLINQYIGDDIRSILKVNKPTTLPEVIQEGRTKTIDITGQQKNTVGANQSVRQVIENNGKKAVFTERSYYNFQDSINNHCKNYAEKYPQYASIFNRFNKEDYYKKLGLKVIEDNMKENGSIHFDVEEYINIGLTQGQGYFEDVVDTKLNSDIKKQ